MRKRSKRWVSDSVPPLIHRLCEVRRNGSKEAVCKHVTSHTSVKEQRDKCIRAAGQTVSMVNTCRRRRRRSFRPASCLLDFV